jgi:hypothetical protein
MAAVVENSGELPAGVSAFRESKAVFVRAWVNLRRLKDVRSKRLSGKSAILYSRSEELDQKEGVVAGRKF